MGRTSWTPGVPGRGDATGGGELVWVAFGDQYRMFDNPGRLSGVLCRKCPEGADAVIATASLPEALQWMTAHEERAHGGQNMKRPPAPAPRDARFGLGEA